jgi:hypothetical protein
MCEALLKRPELAGFPKRHLVVFYLIRDEGYSARVLEKGALRPLDERTELPLLYGNLDELDED